MFRELYGNTAQINHVTSAIDEGRLSHAYIFEGDRGSGKLTFARLTAAYLAGGQKNPCAMKILVGNSPDVTEYDVPEKKKFITVDTVRQIKYDAYIKPNELDVRVFIIKNADSINTAGQNALLKLLEEPPKGVYFFLLCENASTLLPTVRSRAQCIRMERFSEERLKAYLRKSGAYTEDQIEKAAKNSSGSIGKAIELLGNEKTKTSWDVKKLITALSGGGFTDVIIALGDMPSERIEAKNYIDNCRRALRDMIAVKSGRDDMTYFEGVFQAKEASGKLSVKSILMLNECFDDAYKDININMNVQTVRICLAKRLMRALCR
ncbi:MAG: hypothetical protein E7675_03010 [Ruminococcaceae bacterium]|nr:hypothetical protein [Oscillospiraceae bacterium]